MCSRKPLFKYIAPVFTCCFLCNIAKINTLYPEHITIFAHGLGASYNQADYFIDSVGGTIIGKNGSEWIADTVNENMSCLGQEQDIAVINEQIKEHSGESITLLGFSKGASTMINTIGYLSKKNDSYLNNIKAIILNSPFASPENAALNIVITAIKETCGSIVGSIAQINIDNTFGHYTLKKLLPTQFPKYDSNGITPLKAIRDMWKNVNKDMVIVFIHSQDDTIVSINDSRLLYYELKKLNFTNLYFIETEKGGHTCIGNHSDKNYILEKLFLIYAKHNLPFPKMIINKKKPIDTQKENMLSETTQPSASNIHLKLNPLKARLKKWLN